MSTINYAIKLRKVRLFLNITQRELSSRIDINTSSISRYENERTHVSPRVRKWINRMFRKYNLAQRVIKSAKDNTICAFMPQKYYSIADDDKIIHRLALNPCIRDFNFNYVFQYLGTQGIDSSPLQGNSRRVEQNLHK